MSSGDEGKRIVQLIESATTAEPPTRWRQARSKAIQQHCTTQEGDEFAFVAYTLAHFGSSDLAQLTDSELEQTYRHVTARRGR